MDEQLYRKKVLGCWLGKAVGGTLGAPVEGWDGPHHLEFYDPVPETMVPNDDLDLQVVWAMTIAGNPRPVVNSRVLAEAWLKNVGFPWDEYAVAIRNLKNGIYPPFSGSYDKNGLPEDFNIFIEQVHDFVRFYGSSDIFSPRVYNRLRRRKGELIYCSVRFENSGKTYYYTTEDDSIQIGDFVMVPAGKENLPSVVQVVNIQFFTPETAPFPPEKTKRILHRCSWQELEEPEEE